MRSISPFRLLTRVSPLALAACSAAGVGVNLSGVHTAQEGSIDLDASATDFGLEIGKSYTFDLFQAERQPSGSNFRLETTLSFIGCGVILPPDIIVK